MVKLLNSVVQFFFPGEVMTAKEIALNDWCWILSFPLISFSIWLFVMLHINL